LIDGSIATTPERVHARLASIESPVVLLLGGRDKGLPLAGLREGVTKPCRAVICFGEAGSSFTAALSRGHPTRGALFRAALLMPLVRGGGDRRLGDIETMAPSRSEPSPVPNIPYATEIRG
jgi:UDP-N-acetylmuramoylalanine-D-glutamate ligase